MHTENEVLEKIPTKVLRVFLLAIHSYFYFFSFALRFLFFQIVSTCSSVTVYGKGERKKT